MKRKAFLSSPYRQHVCGRYAGLVSAMRLLPQLSPFRVALTFDELQGCGEDAVWSPLIEGHIKSVSGDFGDEEAELWCLNSLLHCTTFIKCETIPTLPGAISFCETELSFAQDMKLEIIRDVDILQGAWNA